MSKSKSELIYLAFEMIKRRLIKEGHLPAFADFKARVAVAKMYKLNSFLDVAAHLKAARPNGK